jgi:hypothetical protein
MKTEGNPPDRTTPIWGWIILSIFVLWGLFFGESGSLISRGLFLGVVVWLFVRWKKEQKARENEILMFKADVVEQRDGTYLDTEMHVHQNCDIETQFRYEQYLLREQQDHRRMKAAEDLKRRVELYKRDLEEQQHNKASSAELVTKSSSEEVLVKRLQVDEVSKQSPTQYPLPPPQQIPAQLQKPSTPSVLVYESPNSLWRVSIDPSAVGIILVIAAAIIFWIAVSFS